MVIYGLETLLIINWNTYQVEGENMMGVRSLGSQGMGTVDDGNVRRYVFYF